MTSIGARAQCTAAYLQPKVAARSPRADSAALRRGILCPTVQWVGGWAGFHADSVDWLVARDHPGTRACRRRSSGAGAGGPLAFDPQKIRQLQFNLERTLIPEDADANLDAEFLEAE